MSLHNSDIEKLKSERDIEGLITLLEDEHHLIRKDAVLALAEISDVSSALPLAQKLKDDYLDIRIAACNALIKMGHEAVETLIEVLKDQNWIVREGAVQALEKIRDTRSINPLIEALKDTNRKRISDALRSIGPASFEPLIEALENDDSRIRTGAAMILGEMKNPAAMTALLKAKKDKNILVRQFATSAIYRIKRKDKKKKDTT